MKILFLAKGGRNVASSNERVWIVSDLLKTRYGFESEIYTGRDITVRTAFAKLFLSHYDILIIHKSLFTVEVSALIILTRLLRRKPMVYDLDDAQWIHSPHKSKWLARTATVVFAGSHEIINWALQFNKNVLLMPTLVDHKHFAQSAVTHIQKPIFTIGWVGGGPEHFKQGNFHLIKPALEELGKRHSDICFRIVGTRGHKELEEFIQSPYYKTDIISFVPYSEVPKQIQQFDIGVMPLVDLLFNRAKCGAKAIQYMACRVPPVVSPVGENAIIVNDGVNGFWARTTEEWVNAFEKLLASAELRNKFGERGQKKVEAEYSHEAVVKKYASTVAALARR